jgi:DNA-binding LytR/AlgR family response regulator
MLKKLTSTPNADSYFDEIADLKLQIADLKDQLSKIQSNSDQYTQNKGKREANEFLILHSNKLIHRIPLDHICLLEAVDNYSLIHLNNGTRHLSSKTLQHWDNQLNGHPHMMRVHRSHTVNLSQLIEIDTEKNELVLKNGSCIHFSRSKKKDIISWMTASIDSDNLVSINN